MNHHSKLCGSNVSSYCPWWCDIHQEHHPVPSMVQDCERLEEATQPDELDTA